MKFGISLTPFTQARGLVASPKELGSIAQHAERMGFDAVYLGDHIVVPERFDSEYPYSATGAFPATSMGQCLEQLTVLTFVAAQTSRIRLGQPRR